MTYQLIYSSEAATPMQLDDLEDILEHARSSNASKGITGALVYVDGVFLQILEGPESSVKALMARIADDVRHETVTVLKETDVDSPVFADWKMAYVSATQEQIARWAGLSSSAELPEILDSMRTQPSAAAQMAQSILTVLGPDSGSHSGLR